MAKQFLTYDTEYDIVKLADHNIKPGNCTNIDSDDWLTILEKMPNSDMVIFATPIWWGIQSSLTQRVIKKD